MHALRAYKAWPHPDSSCSPGLVEVGAFLEQVARLAFVYGVIVVAIMILPAICIKSYLDCSRLLPWSTLTWTTQPPILVYCHAL